MSVGVRRVITAHTKTEADERARQKKIAFLMAKVKEWRRKEDAATNKRRTYEKKLRRAERTP